MDWTPAIIGVATVVGGILGAAITAYLPKKGSAENALIDQLQQEVERQGKRIDAQDERIDTLYQARRRRDAYIQDLRSHIYEQKPPPPPPFPEGLP